VSGKEELRKKNSEFQMGFEPTTFRTIGPRNIYTGDTRHKVVIYLFIYLFIYFTNDGRIRKFSSVDFIPPKPDSPH